MDKKALLKQWRQELKPLGFGIKDNMLRYGPSEGQPLQFGISVQKNLHSDTFKINPTILAKNPLVEAPEAVILMGNVRSNGIALHVHRDSWWSPETLPQALVALKKHALPWFEQYGNPAYLAELLETAIHQKSGLIRVIEPMDEASTSLPWAPPRVATVGPQLYSHAALIHYLGGNRERAIARTKEWLNSLRPDHPDRERASAQLQALTGHLN